MKNTFAFLVTEEQYLYYKTYLTDTSGKHFAKTHQLATDFSPEIREVAKKFTEYLCFQGYALVKDGKICLYFNVIDLRQLGNDAGKWLEKFYSHVNGKGNLIV